MNYKYDEKRHVWVNEDGEEFTQAQLDALEAKLEQLEQEPE